MMTLLMPYVTEETAYRREQLTRAWGRRTATRPARHGRGTDSRGRRRVVPARTRTAVPAR